MPRRTSRPSGLYCSWQLSDEFATATETAQRARESGMKMTDSGIDPETRSLVPWHAQLSGGPWVGRQVEMWVCSSSHRASRYSCKSTSSCCRLDRISASAPRFKLSYRFHAGELREMMPKVSSARFRRIRLPERVCLQCRAALQSSRSPKARRSVPPDRTGSRFARTRADRPPAPCDRRRSRSELPRAAA